MRFRQQVKFLYDFIGTKLEPDDKVNIGIQKLKVWSISAVAFLAAFYFIFMGYTKKYIYFSGLIAVIPLVILIVKWNRSYNYMKSLKEFKARWGTVRERERDFGTLRECYDMMEEDKEGPALDDQTWSDLNLDGIYSKMDRTLTIPGQHALYRILRMPLLELDALRERHKIIEEFSTNVKLREKVGIQLHSLGSRNGDGVPYLINGQVLYTGGEKWLYYLMTAMAIAVLVLIPILKIGAFVFGIVPVFTINMIIHHRFSKIAAIQLNTIQYLRSMIISANNIGSFKDEEIKDYTAVLKEKTIECWDIVKKVGSLFVTDENDPTGLGIYLKIFFLSDVRKYHAAINDIIDKREELFTIFDTLGELDALLSIASFMENESGYCEPELFYNRRELKAEDIYHPLVEDAVSNSINIDNKGVILTGSNMSGKSTFLRTLGLNAVLAQTVFMCYAKSYKAGMFRIMSSISRKDSLEEGKSYYLNEAEEILEMIEAINEKTPLLIIIDEIFRGTNTIERISASGNILKYMGKRNAVVIVATHDLELKEMISSDYESYFFSEKVGEEGLVFDYTLKKGISPGGNAIKILKFLGYPEEVCGK